MKYYFINDSWLVIEPSYPDELIKDFRDNDRLMAMLKSSTKIEYNIDAPLDWLPEGVTYVDLGNFDIDFINGEVIISPNYQDEYKTYKPYEDVRLMWAINKFKKVVYICNDPIDWLPEGIRVLMIESNDFNHPLNNLPSTLESLTLRSLGYRYNMGINGFKQPLDNLPNSLRYLSLRELRDYHHELNNLPANLEYLELFIIYSNKNEISEKEEYYERLCASIPNVYISNWRMPVNKHIELLRKLPKEYFVVLT
jgi:hypothetical protein